jgi:hypothetical protein
MSQIQQLLERTSRSAPCVGGPLAGIRADRRHSNVTCHTPQKVTELVIGPMVLSKEHVKIETAIYYQHRYVLPMTGGWTFELTAFYMTDRPGVAEVLALISHLQQHRN